jgi:CBS domain-containing protein
MTDAQRQAIQREDTVDPVAAALGTVGEAMTKKVVFVRSDLPLTGVAEILNERRLSGAPVVDQGRLVGIVTLQDIYLRIALPTYQVEKVVSMHGWEYLLAELSRRRFSVRDVMTPQVATVRESVALVIRAARAIKRLPVVDDEGRLCRILSRADVVRAVARAAGG